MKQVISIADFSIILTVINDRIASLEYPPMEYDWKTHKEKSYEERKKEHMKRLKADPRYQSLLHAKKALEECKVEIEVPDLEVKDERNSI